MKPHVLWLGLATVLASCGQSTQLSGAIGTGNTAGVAGVVLSAGHQTKADVYLYGAEAPQQPIQSQATDSSGRFRFNAVPVGKYVIFANQNSIIGMLTDTLQFQGVDTSMAIRMKPYVLVPADRTYNSNYCGVSMNTQIQINQTSYWKVPQSNQTFWIAGETTNPSIRYDTRDSTASMIGPNGVISTTRLLKDTISNLELDRNDAESITLDRYGHWLTDSSQVLRISMLLDIDSFPAQATPLLRIGDSLGFTLGPKGSISAIGSHLQLTSLILGKKQHLEFLLSPGANSLRMSNAEGTQLTTADISFKVAPSASVDIHALNNGSGCRLLKFSMQTMVLRSN